VRKFFDITDILHMRMRTRSEGLLYDGERDLSATDKYLVSSPLLWSLRGNFSIMFDTQKLEYGATRRW